MEKIKIIRAVTASQSIGFFEPIVKDLQERGYEIVSVSSPGESLIRLREKGVKVIEVPIERRISMFRDLKKKNHSWFIQ